ncbi:hypothetical protein P170DRAFT_507074 [Aspergillus steynii IBT 23096]|uniref:Uncharacterized protein n=1 Tax=Aspergillus steynii IBT 23096 TaxID=1392250 RepID=A0A2I2GH69_9EURO|nr:uncharacterized protein P170DRAFT_507074 [Aspergillus steynii IBT 23096]PLB52225.1 hypothetical protein P170DRAFT_507074 [Aspergillus steynii IBT 23096]
MSTDLGNRSTRESGPTSETQRSIKDHGEQKAMHQMPTPPSFPTARLFMLLVFYTIATVAIEALLMRSIQNNGLGPSVPELYYVWAHGPIIVFLIACYSWCQVHNRIIEAVARPPEKGSHRVAKLVRLGTCLGGAPWSLAANLLDSQSVNLEPQTVSLVAHSEFSGAKYNGPGVDANPALTVAGVYGLGQPWPVGTTHQHAFPPFSAPISSPESGGIIAGMVDMFTPSLQCEVASVVGLAQECSSHDCLSQKLNLALSTPSCPEYRIESFEKASDSADKYYADVLSAECADAADDMRDPQLIFVAARWNNDQPTVSSIVCKPSYFMSYGFIALGAGNSSVLMAATSNSTYSNGSRPHPHIPGVTPAQLATGFLSTLKNAHTPLLEGNYASGGFSRPNGVHESSFSRIASILSPHWPADLLDTAILERVSRTLYSSVCTQIASQYFLRETHTDFKGAFSEELTRIIVKESIARLIQATLGILIVLVAAILTWRPFPDKPLGHDTTKVHMEVTSNAGLEQKGAKKSR